MRERIKGKTLIASDEGDDASGVIIKLYGEETNGVISIIEQPFEPGLLLPPHVHENDVWLYVLEGEMHARVGEEVVKATPGSWVLKPRRIPHTMWNSGPEPARLIELYTPGGVRDVLQGLRRALAPRADRARRTESPWRAARYPFLRRLDCRSQSGLQPAAHRRVGYVHRSRENLGESGLLILKVALRRFQCRHRGQGLCFDISSFR